MNELSFDIKTSADFLKKLKEDFAEYRSDKTSARHALNCAMTAWHLSEWIYHEFNFDKTFKKVSDFQEDVKNKCRSLIIMHDISNGSKHFELKRHEPKIKKTEKHLGSFDSSFDFSFDTSRLEISMKDGRILVFETEIEIVINFWDNYLQNLSNNAIPPLGVV